jgi:ribosome-associated toxin RatA of RatAB toxin-antitoxin module
MFGVMGSSRRARAARWSFGISFLLALAASGCGAAGQSPRTVVDHVGGADGSTAGDAGASGDSSAKGEVQDVEPIAVAIPGSDLVEAKATVKVGRSIDKARETILKFEDYPRFMPEYSDAKMLGKLPSGDDKVYMEVTTLGGVARMYANVDVLPVKKDGLTEVYEAKFLDGNVRQFKATWTLTKVDENRTEITLQVFLHPAIPLPDFIVNKANMDGAKKGVLAMKKRIENAP